MKLFIFITILYFGRVAFSCNKNNDPVINTSSSLIVNLNSCAAKSIGSQTVTLCLDSILQDSRCPKNVTCVSSGIAVAKFSLTSNGNTYPFILASLNSGGYKTDTLLSGYKIKFINLSPYPGTYTPPLSASQVNAEVQITQ